MPYQLEAGYLEQMPEEGRTVTQFPCAVSRWRWTRATISPMRSSGSPLPLVLGFGYIMLVRHQMRRAAGLDRAGHSYLSTAGRG
jgi:hypothetical protein